MARKSEHTCADGARTRLSDGCEACDLIAYEEQGLSPAQAAAIERENIVRIRAHNCATSGCGPVCVFGDW